MENNTNINEGLVSLEKLSLINRIKLKLFNFKNFILNKNKDSKKEKTWIERNKGGIIIAIALISTFITVKVSFDSLASSPAPMITKNQAKNIISELYGTIWISEQGNNDLPNEFKGQTFEKMEFSNQLMNDGLTVPINLLQNTKDAFLGVEMGYVFYDISKNILFIALPNNEVLKFLYTSASTSEMENISLIGEDNKRYYFVKEN